MGLPTPQDFGGFGPHDIGEFGLWLQVNFGNVLPRSQMKVEEGVVKLHGPKGRRDAMAEDADTLPLDGEGLVQSKR